MAALEEEAAERGHIKIGRDSELFFFHDLSPGSSFFLPRGTHIYNKLIDFIRSEYRRRGYQEVMTPNVYHNKLLVTSGDLERYDERIFKFDVENDAFTIKPMNCPAHCLIFDHRPRSWRELPLRFADFGVLHRNELSSSLSGLTMNRRFQEDDGHIFCTPEQIAGEINGCLDFLKCVCGALGFTFKLYLSTRPESFKGDPALWDNAEKQLEDSLRSCDLDWEKKPGANEIVGPKIDIVIQDTLERSHQCSCIQLDFQLPEKFGLNYVTGDSADDHKRPVMIHRAMLGSMERMVAILTESYGGKWPFWLSPRQAMIVPVDSKCDRHAETIHKKLHDAGFMVDMDLSADPMDKKIHNAQLNQYNYILVVAKQESVYVHTRDNAVVHKQVKVKKLIDLFNMLTVSKALEHPREF